MDFKLVLEKLLGAFKEQKIRHALMGGFAMGLWGAGRATVDLDFLVLRDDMEQVDGVLQTLGYERRYGSENVSQYVSPLRLFGEVDFLHAFREASVGMLERAVEKEIFGSLRIKVLVPEDLIGLKLQAIKNNPERKQGEMEDILFLVEHHRDEMDWALIRQYAEILEMKEVYEDLCEKKG